MNTPLLLSHQQRTLTNLRASRRLPWSIALLKASRRASSTNCSSPETQREPAIRLVSQSTRGEIRPISLRNQVCTSNGAVMKRRSRSADRRDLKLPTQIISVPFHVLLIGYLDFLISQETVRSHLISGTIQTTPH